MELAVSLPAEPIHLHGDRARLAQVLGNLLNNACKFTHQGGHVHLTVERAGSEAIVSVTDDGIGISAEALPHIFDMFMQVDRSLERTQSGLGIGLTLVKQLVELHRGSVEAQSGGPDRGSRFVVRLPILPAQESRPHKRPATQRPSAVRRVLVVDDNQDAANSLALLLGIAGIETRTAHNGLHAVELAEEFRPQAVLLDIGLPVLNGYAAAQRIRGEPWGKSIVLVALTGWGQDEDRRKSKEAGFDHHMVKPVDHAVLMDLLASLPADERGPGGPPAEGG
jgi:CheY-like chemotaxis protein